MCRYPRRRSKKHMKQSHHDRSLQQPKTAPLWGKIGLIVALGVVVGSASVLITGNVYKTILRTRIDTIASVLDTSRVQRLSDAGPGNDSADYNYIKTKLAAIKGANDDVRFVYLMTRDAQGQVRFLADSEPSTSPDYSPQGQLYPEASPALKAMFDSQADLIEGPSKDSYGNWLSALTPIINDQTYRFVGVVGIDIPASSYSFLLALAGGIPLVLALLAAVIVYSTDQIRRRRQEATRFRAEMVSIASHELRTPLTGLRWSEEGLLDGRLTAKQRDALEVMHQSTLRLQDSIEDILQLANLETGKAQRLFLHEVDLRALIDGIFAMQKLAAGRNKTKLGYADGWPKTLPITADSQRLKRVFNNLISNAIKYSRPDTIITVGYGRTNAGSHVISIQDHGIGIPAHEQSKVFSGFYRATNASASDIAGTGMGLYLSRAIIAQHGGKLWLESEEGKGTTVFVQLPG